MKQQIKSYKSAPLPFQGQKRRWVKDMYKVLSKFDKPTTVIDLFGGSGLLSYTVKQLLPQTKVIYNDFDNYTTRIQNIDKTNVLLANLREILEEYPRLNRIEGTSRAKVISLLQKENRNGFVDWITISSNLLFSMQYALNFNEFKTSTLYNRICLSDYCATGYLHGLEIVNMDYIELFTLYKNEPNVLFIIDPPYLSTDISSYNSKGYWKLPDYLDILTILNGVNYIFFTSNRSSLIELTEWMGAHPTVGNPFYGAETSTTLTQACHTGVYTDIMLSKKA